VADAYVALDSSPEIREPARVANLAIWKQVIPPFVTWKLAILFITLFGLSFFAIADPKDRTLSYSDPSLDYWARWGTWDGGHYQGIAVNGYAQYQTAWFPAYPVLIKILMLLGVPPLWAGLAISHVSALAAMYYLYRLALLEFGDEVAKRVIFALLIFPTSFYLGAVYNESLFLAVAAASFYYARNSRWLLASILAGAAGATRVTGLAVIAGASAEYLLKNHAGFEIKALWQTQIRRLLLFTLALTLGLNLIRAALRGSQPPLSGDPLTISATVCTYVFSGVAVAAFMEAVLRNIIFRKVLSRQFAYLLLSLVPFVLYMAYQQVVFGNPLSFMANEARYNKVLTFPWRAPQDVVTYLVVKHFVEVGGTMRILVYLIFFAALATGFIFCLSRFRSSYTVYYFLALLIPLLSGTLMDFPRYSLAVFPFFFAAGHVRNELLQNTAIMFSILMLSAMAMLFVNGYWFM